MECNMINQMKKLSKRLFRINQYIKSMNQIKTKLEIIDKTALNHDCYLYTFKWDGPMFELTIGQHLRIVETIPTYDVEEGQELVRKYSPISPCSQKDTVKILFKIYRPNVNPKFPKGGKLTPYLEKLQVGDKVNVEGPFGRFGYKAGGTVIIDKKQMIKKRIFFIVGGTGITPVYQTINEIMKMENQNIQMIVIFGNKTEEDIILRKQLEEMVPRITLYFILDNPPEGWTGFGGYMNKDLLQKLCPLDDPDTLYLYCGPSPMNMMIRELFAKNFPDSTLFKY